MSFFRAIKKHWMLYLMILPALLFYLVFCYLPMHGIVIAFQDYNVLAGIANSEWVGLANFEMFIKEDYFWQIIWNTLSISVLKLAIGFTMPIIVALLINELFSNKFKRTVQTFIYLPHFISWSIISGILIIFLSPSTGLINNIIEMFGGQPQYFMIKPEYFKPIVIISDIWKNVGWGTIIYTAAIAGINGELYEASYIDGAGRLRQTWHITLPGIKPVIVMMLILSVSNILSAGFDQIVVMQNANNLEISEIIDTYIYSAGIQNGEYSLATAMGLFKAFISLGLLIAADRVAKLFGERGII